MARVSKQLPSAEERPAGSQTCDLPLLFLLLFHNHCHRNNANLVVVLDERCGETCTSQTDEEGNSI